MAAIDKAIQAMVKELGRKKPHGVNLGQIQDNVYKQLLERSNDYVQDLAASANDVRHLQKSRIEKPRPSQKMTPEQIGDMVNSLKTSTRAKVVTSKNPDYPDAVVVPHGEHTYFGVYRRPGTIENEKFTGLQTAYNPKTKALPNKLGSAKNEQVSYRDWVDANLPSNYAPRSSGGREFTQRQLSAVEPQQLPVNGNIGGSGDDVKLFVPGAVISNAVFDEGFVPKEKGLSEPWLDPVSMLTAPIGVAGAGAKAVATALDPAINAMMQSLLGE